MRVAIVMNNDFSYKNALMDEFFPIDKNANYTDNDPITTLFNKDVIEPLKTYSYLESFCEHLEDNNNHNNWLHIMGELYQYNSYEKIINCLQKHNQTLIQQKIEDAVELNNKELNINSLIHLLKFWPEFKRKQNLYLYIDSDTSFWSMLYKKPNDGTLNMLIKDNGEILFSYVKSENHGSSKFSGRARINKNPKNFKHINKLLNLIE